MRSGFLTRPFADLDIPVLMRCLARDRRGFPVPWFVDRLADDAEGNPDFRIMDRERLRKAIKERLCWVCGQKIAKSERCFVFVAGPMCGVNRTSAEPPSHYACAVFSARACPFLTMPKMRRNEKDIPEGADAAGIMIKRNPGVTMLWRTGYYETFRTRGGLLFEMGPPVSVEWFCQGRIATRDEVVQSVASGFPLLLQEARKEGHAGEAALAEAMLKFRRYLPKEPANAV